MKNPKSNNKKRHLIRDIIIKPRIPKWERSVLIKKEAEEYIAIHKSQKHPAVKQYRKSKHFMKWAMKLIAPDFLIGHPNLWDNLKTLRKHPQFRPLRMVLVCWLIFVLIVGSTGVYSLLNSSKIKAASWYDSNYSYRQEITINSSQVATTTTNGFVILATTTQSVLKTSTNGGNVEKDDGSDIVFVHSDDATVLDYHLESYASTTGEVVAWIEVLDIASTTNKTFYMYYGNSGATDLSDETGTYNSSYLGVWHLNETPADSGTYYDSTGNNNDGTWQDSDSSGDSNVNGQIAGGNSFNSNDKIATPITTALNDLTVEVWFKDDGSAVAYERLADKNHVSCFWLGRNGSTADSWGGGIMENADPYGVFVTLSDGDWHHIASVRDGTTHYVYGDGGSVSDSNTVSDTACDNINFGIGAWGDAGSTQQRFGGTIDEVRIYNIALHAMDLLTNYNYSSDNSSFLTFAAEEQNNVAPNTPTHSSPADATTEVSLTPTLTSSAFSDSDAGNTHQASQWQVATTTSFDLPVWDSSATTTVLTSVTIPSNFLTASTTYYWRVKHQDNNDSWSSYSSATSFLTVVNWYNVSWAYRQKLTVDSTKVSNTTQTNFPVMVDLSDLSSGFFTNVNSDGSDIVVTSADGQTKLKRELESINTGSSIGILWFKAPSLYSATNTDFFIYYGSSGATETDDTDTWDSNYKLIQHLQETDIDGGSGDIKDSTINANNGTTSGMDINDQIAGKIGGSFDFDGNNDYVDVGDSASISGFNAITISMWYKRSGSFPSGEYDVFIDTENDNATDRIGFMVLGSGASQYFRFSFKDSIAGEDSDAFNVDDNNWHHVAVSKIIDGTATYYLDGLTKGTKPGNAGTAGTGDEGFRIGIRADAGAHPLNGAIDEVRVSNTARSVEWIVTEYNNQNSPATFYSVSSQQVSPNNAPNTPTNSSPANSATNQSLTPTFSASAFSDPNPSDTHASSQWQITTTSGNYDSTVYDSGATTTALTSIIIPSGNLSADTTYYWHAKYRDNNNTWSSYSSEFSFTISSPPSTPSNSSPSNGANNQNTTLTLSSSSFSDSDSGSSHGASWWKIRSSSDSAYASPIYDSGASTTALTSAAIPQGTLSENTIYYWKVAYQDEQDVWSATSTETAFVTGVIPIVVTAVGATEFQTGETAKLVVQVTDATGDPVNDATVTFDFFDTSDNQLANNVSMSYVSSSDGLYNYSTTTLSTEGVYTYSVKATASGESSYSSHTFHVSPALNTINTNLNATISSRSSQTSVDTVDTNIDAILVDTSTTIPNQITNASTSITDKIDVVTSTIITEIQTASTTIMNKLDTIEAKIDIIDTNVDTILSTLNTVDTNLDAVQTTVNTIRASQQNIYSVKLSDTSEIQVGNIYRAKLFTLDYQSDPIDASTTPTIAIYDSTRTLVGGATTTMTKLDTGVYQYSTTTASDATAGLWESIVITNIGGSDLITNDYWQVTGAPAQVIINSMSDLTVSSISANTTIENEGNGAFEYQYEWCVVSSQANQCGGDDDVYYASAAKLIQVGQSYTSNLTATVLDIGGYWFKVVVYYGTEASGASRSFTAIEESGDEETSLTLGSGIPGTVGMPQIINISTVYREVRYLRQQMYAESEKISKVITLLGDVNSKSPGFRSLLQINEENTENINSIQNKIADLRAVSSITRRIVEEKSAEPIIETYMKFNSVEVVFLITNPASIEQTIRFKSFLPEEVKPEYILNSSGLKVDYDANAGVYYVSGNITLEAGETVTRKVEMKDIWLFPKEELESLRSQSENLVETLEGTQYEAQGALLKNDIVATLETVLRRQKENYSSPQNHIVAYRENKIWVDKMHDNLEKIKELVVQSGADQGLFGKIGGIQTFSTWGIILAIIFGFSLLAVVIFAMWKHQMKLAAITMGLDKEILTVLGSRRNRRKRN